MFGYYTSPFGYESFARDDWAFKAGAKPEVETLFSSK